MKNIIEINEALGNAKSFATENSGDASPDTVEEIQSLLSLALAKAKDNDIDGVASALDEIDAQNVNGWDLTSAVRSLL